MRYLKIYEAFESKGINSTLDFLKKKVGKKSSILFLDSLKTLMTSVDLPIDKISDDDIDYMSAKRAALVKSKKDVNNDKEIDTIKYWFSIKDGYLGFTGTGNKIIEKSSSIITSYPRQQRMFSSGNLDWITENVIPTGELYPISDYSNLKTGDVVLGCFNDSYDSDHISLGTVFVNDIGESGAFVIQSVSSGSGIGDPGWRNYTQYGNLTWWIADSGRTGTDHSFLNYWRNSSEELHYVENLWETEKKEEKEEEKDPITWNLPLDDSFNFERWGRSHYMSQSDYEKADFALILKYDDLLKKSYKKPSNTRKIRKEEKAGATKLMSDDKIKKMNIERYISKLSFQLNITETDFFNLEKFVKINLCGDFSFISIWTRRPDWSSNLSTIIKHLYRVADCESMENKRYYLDSIKDLYKDQSKYYYNYLTRFLESRGELKPGNIKNIFDNIFKLSKELNLKLIKKDINSIDELYLIREKINTFHSFSKMDRNELSYGVREIISQFSYPEDMKRYYEAYSRGYTEQDYENDLEKIKRMSEFLKRL
jgi:hypothetical protein